jgi:hypothetical protein
VLELRTGFGFELAGSRAEVELDGAELKLGELKLEFELEPDELEFVFMSVLELEPSDPLSEPATLPAPESLPLFDPAEIRAKVRELLPEIGLGEPEFGKLELKPELDELEVEVGDGICN